MKICRKCNIEKSLNEYRVRQNGAHFHQCKLCESEYFKKRRNSTKSIRRESAQLRKEEKRLENTNKLINEFVGKEFGSFVVNRYVGYYCTNKTGYPRHYFERTCKFCNSPKTVLLSRLNKNTLCKCRETYKLNKNKNTLCSESYDVNTNQKKCSCCNLWLDATNEFFPKSKNRPLGLHYYCFTCSRLKRNKMRESKEYRQKEYVKHKQRIKTDHLFKLSCGIRVLIKNYIKRVNITRVKKSTKTQDILGCNFFEFKEYIEKQFTEGMTWDNYGEWHLDHIVPVSLGVTESEVIELCHHSNYRPLWSRDNLSKNNKILLEIIPEELKVRYKKYIERG
jgi:hypothetical protein